MLPHSLCTPLSPLLFFLPTHSFSLLPCPLALNLSYPQSHHSTQTEKTGVQILALLKS